VDVSVPDEIIPGQLYIGAEGCLRNSAVLELLGIVAVLSVCHLQAPLSSVEHKIIPINDSADVRIR
jgi:hypothetical protein